MSNIKDLFGKNNIKVLPGKSLGNLVTGSGVESAGYIQSTDEEKLRFEPYVDYSIPKSFARYGSAEKYYTDTIDYIINRYPYDGSGKEKANWYLSSSYFDNYLFENEYPRTHGFINLGINYGGVGGGGVSGYEAPTVDEYIYFKGGPHTASAGMIGKPLSQTFTGSNYYKDDVRESNLELNAPVGNSVEFWFKKNGWAGDPVESEKQIFVDVWNSASIGNTYGRFRVECDFGITPHQFSVAFQSGTTNGFLDSDLGKIGQSINLTGSTWNHYALTFANVGSDLEAKLYVNGDLNDTITTGSIINKITGSMLGWIGAMGTSINSPVTGALGYAKLSGSMDEFRFWKSSRTETEVGRYWFTQVNAGSNTDLSNVDLGVYYKFNEGIVDTTAIATLDTNVLDYSGRITNGSWTGYDLGSRNTGSAMVISKAALSEFKDPIIYPSNPLVSVFRTTKKNIGYDYDVRNNSGIYTSIPEYITGDSQEIRGGTLKNLTQIIGSYFDDVQLQIESLPKVKNVQYTTGSQKIAPFINRFLSGVGLYTPEIFADASALEYYASRDDFLDFSKKLNDTKNRIYENIYNNLVHVFKTKGTENSFRNLMRCYGVDEPLMKISLYGDETTQELRTNSRNTTAQKSFVDFNNVDRFDSTVYQQTSSTDTNTRNFITASSDMQFIPKTMQAEAIFPKKFKQDSELYFRTPFISCSLFGAHTPTSADQTDLTWATNDWSNFQVYAVRTEIESDDVYFKLTSSAGGVIPLITSSVYTDVYANTKWNLAVRIKPDNYYIPGLSGSEAGSASVEFVGYNSLGDNVENNFYLTASISLASASAFLSSSTRVYAGSHRTNFTGSSIDLSDAKISSVRYWIDDLPNEAIEAHSKDASAFGPLEPHKSAYLVKNTADFFQQIEAPQAKTLSLSWTFDTVTGSSDSSTGSPTLSDANFFVPDLSSGSTATTSEYGWLGPVVNFLHSGKGDFFLPFDTNAVNREYVYSAKQLAPEILNSSNMVEVRTQDDELFTRETRPQNYFYAIEKSQSAIISEEMMKWFATIKDFNFLIGDPVNRYRQEYKPLAKLREVYFRSVGNTIDFERFVDFFKWVDDSLSQMLMQLVPASANFAEKVRTMIESHVLERNKYWSKFPTLEMKLNDPEAGARGIVEGTYPWKRGHAPIPLAQDDNCYWANNRASASVFPSGDAEVDAGRNIYRLADDFRNGSPPTLTDISSGTPTQYQGSAYAIRNFTKTYLLKTKEMPELKGGTNVARIKNLQYAHTELPFGASTKLTISSSQVEGNIDCNDVVEPNDKVKLRYKLTNNPIGYKSGNGNIFAPFDLMSSSVSSGYASQLPRMGPDAVFVDLVNYHNDTYGSDKEVPMQGPFTEKYVGGWKHRHVPFPNTNCSPSTGSLATGSLADQCRPEAWNLETTTGCLLDNQFSMKLFPQVPFFGGLHKAVELPDVSRLSDPSRCFIGNKTGWPSGLDGDWSVAMWFKVEPLPSNYVAQTLMSRTRSTGTPFPEGYDFNVNMYVEALSAATPRAKLEYYSYHEDDGDGSVTSVETSFELIENSIADGKWHLVCFGMNDGGIFLDLDNGAEHETALLAGPKLGTDVGDCKVGIGAYWSSISWTNTGGVENTYVDEVSLWDNAISFVDINEIWNGGGPGCLDKHDDYDDVISWYRMGDAPGDDCTDGGPIIDVATGPEAIYNNGICANTDGTQFTSDIPPVGFMPNITLSSRTAHQARSTILREPLAKRPINIRNIKQTTGSTIIGNYSHQYEVLQTSGRKINNRFFVKNGGFVPEYSTSSWVSGLVEYALPDFSKYGATKNIFVERFNAPGGPDVSSRGVLDLYAEEYAVRNDLNQRNMVVRGPLNEWSTEHCGPYGTDFQDSVSALNYNVSASYHKVNRNRSVKYNLICWGCFTEPTCWTVLPPVFSFSTSTTISKDCADPSDAWDDSYSAGDVGVAGKEGIQFQYEPPKPTPNIGQSAIGLIEGNIATTGYTDIKYGMIRNTPAFAGDTNIGIRIIIDGVIIGSYYPEILGATYSIMRFGSLVYFMVDNTVFYFVDDEYLGSTLYPKFNIYSSYSIIHGFKQFSVADTFDNWFVQHSIPQSDLQYAWISDSYHKSFPQPPNHVGSPNCGRNNFSVPSGSSESMAAETIQFVTASATIAGGIYVDFVGMNTLVYDPMFTASNLLSSSNGSYLNTSIATIASYDQLNSLNLHRNGPYQYPSWKQIRTGETPVARYQKNNNIISFKKEEDIYGSNEVTPANAGLTRDTLIHFTEPPVTFRYKPVGTTLILSGSPDPLTLNSVYGNNMGGFPNPDINNFLGTSIKCEEQMYDRIKGMYHNAPSDSPVQEMLSVDYSEIVYPREIHAGLKEYRQRTEYAEVADGTNIYSGGKVIFVSASLSNGSNGIDRGPLYRRTFWRTDPVFRNRRSSLSYYDVSTDFKFIPDITGVLPNSQGYRSGFATSVNGWGTHPMVFVTGTIGVPLPRSRTATYSGSFEGLDLLTTYSDCGELNSANFQTIAGYLGTADQSSLLTATPIKLAVNSSLYPTASCYYYHQHSVVYPGTFGTSSLGMKWRVAELSGKNPWFDTYEDYVQDIRGTGKSFTIIPEFRISQHMDYYADGLFRKQNDQFLTLDGATITSSAVAPSPTSSNISRGFDKQFFSEYSNTDFQKYFGKFDADNQVNEITLKCNGIKKLLPYHGFYPSHRTLQVASLFSQSIAPYIGGIAWASGTTTEATTYPSGALAVQSLLQPYYAPGILYNTIKAGIACDWAAYTGSAHAGGTSGNNNPYLNLVSNYRIPFESILEPLADVGIPVSSSDGEGKLNLIYPSYRWLGGTSWAAHALGDARAPYIDLEDIQRARAISSTKYNQYRLAINNLLAEIPSFFLKDNKLKTIVSKPAGEVSLVSGTTYYMNVYLEKDPNIVMMQDYWNGLRGNAGGYEPNPDPLTDDTEYRSWNGRFFGPPVQAGAFGPGGGLGGTGWGNAATRMGDPAYAPYTPPYFYGKSVSTIAYTADESDEDNGFNYKKVFEKATVTQTNPTMKNMFEVIRAGQTSPATNSAIALSGAMGLSSSLNLFGFFPEPQTAGDDAGNLISATNNQNPGLNKWVISPRMETPVLDFSTQPEQKGWGRGMWSGYGNILTSSNGITFGIEETYKGGSILQSAATGSLLQKCFTNPEEKQVGEIASQKEISEAIVAIPFSVRGFSKESRHPETTVMMNKNFFRIDQDVFDANRQHYLASKNKIFSADPLLGQSVTKMLKMMDKYIIPPELDSLNFPEGNLKVDPFVMYMFEFNHSLSQQDLADIWQGVMPDISRIAQLSDTTVDDNVFTHPTGPNEFFGGKAIPEDIRWMVFKVKKRASFNYYKMTADTSDDDKFSFDFNVGGKDLPYSYNWPYDFCSLIELAEIEVKDQFIERTPIIEIPGIEDVGVTRILDHLKDVSSGEEEE